MIINRKTDKPEKIKIVKDEDGQIIHYADSSFHFKKSKIEYFPDVAYLRYTPGHGLFLAQASEIGESRSGLAYSYLRNGWSMSSSVSENLIVAFFIGADKNISLYVFGNISEDSSIDEDIIETDVSKPLEVFSSNIAEASEFVQRLRAKQKLLRRVNEMDVLAAMEAQLDLVTSIVLSQYSDEDLRSAIDGCMVTEIHNKETLISTIKKQKQYLRELQREYFATRGTAINGKPTAA